MNGPVSVSGAGALSDAKRALLAQRLAGGRGNRAGPRGLREVAKRRSGEPVPLAPGQEGLWYLRKLSPDSPGYTVVSAFRVPADGVNLDLLGSAAARVVERHEILRSRLNPDGASARIVLDGGWSFAVNQIDCSAEGLITRAEKEARRPFPLESGPLLRMTYLHREVEGAILMLTADHLVCDEWSLNVFWSEVSEVYGSLLAGKEASLPAIAVQYADFACWQRERLAEGLRAEQLGYWRAELAGMPPVLELPVARTRSPNADDAGRLESRTISSDLTGRLRALAASEDASLYMMLLLCYQVLLSRYSGQDDFAVGTPAANRQSAELAGLIGFFLSVVPLRVRFAEGMRVRDALRMVKGKVLGALQRLDLPFHELVADCDVPRVPGLDPIFQVMFAHAQREETSRSFALGECRLEPLRIETGRTKFDLTLFTAETVDGLECMIEYRTSLFERSWIARMLAHYEALLWEMVRRPEDLLAGLEMAGKDERQALLNLSRGETLTAKVDSGVELTIAGQAKMDPEAAAVHFEGTVWSRGKLEGEIQRLSGVLAERGVRQGDRVALYVERSPAAIAAILAVLRRGAAYVPVDPGYPDERKGLLLADCGANVILGESRYQYEAERLAPKESWVWIDSACPEVPVVDGDRCEAAAEWEDPAYVIYTSGSTGKPKGVVVTRRNLRDSTLARMSWYGWHPARFLLVPSLSFDSSVAGLFWTLAAGGSLVLPNADASRSPRELADLIEREEVDSLLCVPTLYGEILRAAKGSLGSLRHVIVAGEPCPGRLLEEHLRVSPGALLYNEYGPTEATVWATACEVTNAPHGVPVPIGRPIPGTRVYVVDRWGKLLPIGVPGEIWIGGLGVTAGYHEREEETRRRFVADPFDEPDRGRIYRTGDRGRWREDGNLEFLGRVDDQVKVNGYRVEPGEIEEALRAAPGVRDAAATVVRWRGFAAGEDPSVEALCERLGRLPSEERESLLREVERGAGGAAERAAAGGIRELNRSRFQVILRELHKDFVRPPRDSQRIWLLEQAMSEFGDDLEHLDALAKRFVPGRAAVLRDEDWDIGQAVLPPQKIMEDWQIPLMRAMAAHVCDCHGDVLEIGFGRGVSAEFIQQGGVRSHTVVEPNDHSVRAYYMPWREKHSQSDIRLLHGRWQDVEAELGMYDGIFFHAFPLNEREFIEFILRSVTFAEHAFPAMARHLRDGGVFTYLTTEVDSLSRRHQRALFRHFRSLTLSVHAVEVPEDTQDAWWAPSMVVIKAVK